MKKLFITVVLVISMLLTTTLPGYAMGSPANWSLVGGDYWSQDRDAGFVYALLNVNGTLFAGTNEGVWSWNGSSWSQVGGSNGLGSKAQIYEQYVVNLAAVNGTLYAGQGSGTGSGGVWSWNGSSWSQVSGSSGFPSDAFNVQSLDGTLYAMAFYSLWSWNGSSWSQVGGYVGPPGGSMAMESAGFISSLAEVNGTLYAGTANGVWSLNGSTWSQVGGSGGLTGNAAYVDSLATINGTLYAGTANGVWSWNGSSWSQVSGGGPTGSTGVDALAAANGTLYAAYEGFSPESGPYGMGVWSWNGSSWSQVGGSEGLTGRAASVSSLAATGGTLYAGTGGDGVFSIPISKPTLPSTVEFTIGSDQYTSDAVAESVYAAPFVENGRTYLGIRDMGYAIGMDDSNITWNSDSGTATFNYDGHTVVFTLDSRSYTVDSGSQQMDVTPIDLNGRIFVPASYFAQAFGYQASWNQATQVVSLTLQG